MGELTRTSAGIEPNGGIPDRLPERGRRPGRQIGNDDVARRLTRRQAALARAADWTMARCGLSQPVVMISGFWRSGTTWLQEIIADSVDAKTIFEPLSPFHPARRAMLRRAGLSNPGLQEAFIPPAAQPDDALWTYLDRAMYGFTGNRFAYTCRTRVVDSLRRPIVVKDVRMQFNLARIHERYRLPVVHIRRHPGAVVASLRSRNWHWNFADVRLADAAPALRAELAEFDTDEISRISAYWALTERQVANALRGRAWARMVDYESLVAAPLEAVTALCGFIGCEQRRVPNFGIPSASHFGVPQESGRSGPERWRAHVSARDVARIRDIVGRLYPEFDFASP